MGERWAGPKEEARDIVDGLLEAVGWTVQDYNKLNLGASLEIVFREANSCY